MKKKKATKEKRIYHKLTFWLGVLVLGTIVGISIQFSRAWVEPSSTAPDGNIAAPINTGASVQTKVGTASQKADICVDPNGTGDTKCLGDLVSFPTCTKAGGIPTTMDGITLCKFPYTACPSGWVQPAGSHYTETEANYCTGAGSCGTSVWSSSHSFANIDPATDARSYSDGSTESYSCGCSSCCTSMCSGPYGWIVCCGYDTCGCSTCSRCVAVPRTCVSDVRFVGCVAI